MNVEDCFNKGCEELEETYGEDINMEMTIEGDTWIFTMWAKDLDFEIPKIWSTNAEKFNIKVERKNLKDFEFAEGNSL